MPGPGSHQRGQVHTRERAVCVSGTHNLVPLPCQAGVLILYSRLRLGSGEIGFGQTSTCASDLQDTNPSYTPVAARPRALQLQCFACQSVHSQDTYSEQEAARTPAGSLHSLDNPPHPYLCRLRGRGWQSWAMAGQSCSGRSQCCTADASL